VNANGKRIDAWLIYRCTSCNRTWNRPIAQRQNVKSIDPCVLAAMRRSDPDMVRRAAFDSDGLKRWAPRIAHCNDVLVLKKVLSPCRARTDGLEIACVVPNPITFRVDRLLAAELHLSRNRILSLQECGDLRVAPNEARTLGKPVRDGMRLAIKLSGADAGCIAAAASATS
jgi:hypothetical protein